MKTTHTNPTCPTCGYDLAGIIREDNTVTCPECGEAINQISKQRTTYWISFERALLIPFLITTTCWIILPGVSPVDTAFARTISFIMAAQLLYLIAYGIWKPKAYTQRELSVMENTFLYISLVLSMLFTGYLFIRTMFFYHRF